MADACLTAIGVETSAEAVGRHYGARSEGGLLDGWLVDTADAGATVPGVEVRAVPLLMRDLDATAAWRGRRWTSRVPRAASRCSRVEGLPEVRPGDDVAALVAAAVELQDGDVVVVTSKVLSKAEGRLVPVPPGADREQVRQEAVAAETARVVARRGATVIAQNRQRAGAGRGRRRRQQRAAATRSPCCRPTPTPAPAPSATGCAS